MTIYGADTSHWKWAAGTDFVKAKASGKCDFLFAKATEGVGYVDPSYSGWRGAKAIGILFGSFHFARPGSPVEQADYYLSAAKPVAGELVCLDLEDAAITAPGAFGAAFCQRVKAKTGAWPLLYTYPDYLRRFDLSPIQRLGVQLWFADYSDPLNSMKPWSSYAIRQFSSTGSVPGLPATNVDLNSSPLTLDQLRGYAIGAQEDDMPLTPQDAETVWDKPINDGATAEARLVAIQTNAEMAVRRLDKLIAAQTDPGALAAALAPLLPSSSAPSEADLETALRKVFGSLDNAPS